MSLNSWSRSVAPVIPQNRSLEEAMFHMIRDSLQR